MNKQIYDLKVIRVYTEQEAEKACDELRLKDYELLFYKHKLDRNKIPCFDIIFELKTLDYCPSEIEYDLNNFVLNKEINNLRKLTMRQ